MRFGPWWDANLDTYRALGATQGAWRHIRQLLPAGLVMTGAAVVVLNILRVITGDEDRFTRYVMGTFWVIVGSIAVAHGVMQVQARRPATPAPHGEAGELSG